MLTIIDGVAAPLLHRSVPVNDDAVNNEVPQLLVTFTTGAVGNVFTVNVAAFEFTVPALLVQTAWYCLALSAAVTTNVKVAFVAPGILVHVVPLVLNSHCTVGTGVPLAAAVKLTFSPAHFDCDAGCVVIEGDTVTTPGFTVTTTF